MGALVKGILLIGIASLLWGLSQPALSQTARSGLLKKPVPKVKLAHPEIPRIPARELVQLLKKKAEIVVVDTQDPDGYEMWHIPSAVSIPYISTEDPTNRQLMLMALPLDKPIVIYCLCEEGTDSAKMAIELIQLGYSKEKVRVLEGGLALWDEKGYPMVKTKIP
jgi:rhodanese-related sulfurtransferase